MESKECGTRITLTYLSLVLLNSVKLLKAASLSFRVSLGQKEPKVYVIIRFSQSRLEWTNNNTNSCWTLPRDRYGRSVLLSVKCWLTSEHGSKLSFSSSLWLGLVINEVIIYFSTTFWWQLGRVWFGWVLMFRSMFIVVSEWSRRQRALLCFKGCWIKSWSSNWNRKRHLVIKAHFGNKQVVENWTFGRVLPAFNRSKLAHTDQFGSV